MSDANREENVRYLLDRIDRKGDVKKDAMEEKRRREVEFLTNFLELKEREIIPAFDFYRKISPETFSCDISASDSATISIKRGGRHEKITYRAVPEVDRVRISTDYREPYECLLSQVTKGGVKSAVDELLEVMARP